MRSPTSARILVVGAGIAGLGTARALARAGFAAEVVERQRTCQETGAGIYLPVTRPVPSAPPWRAGILEW